MFSPGSRLASATAMRAALLSADECEVKEAEVSK